MKMTSTGADLYEEVKKAIQSLDVPVEKLTGLMLDRAPSMAGRNSGVYSLTVKDVENTADCDPTIFHCWYKKIFVPNPSN
jgi:hypothetical protein